MNRCTLLIVVSAVFLAAGNDSRAAIIERDLYEPGDGLLTFDTNNQREWLDLNATPRVTYGELDAAHSPSETLNLLGGFQIATFDDVKQLTISAGIAPEAVGFHPARVPIADEIKAVVDLIAKTSGEELDEREDWWGVVGLVSPIVNIYQQHTASILAWTSSFPLGRPITESPGADVRRFSSLPVINPPILYSEDPGNRPIRNAWLFRVVVPEPPSMELITTALAVAPFVVRRRR